MIAAATLSVIWRLTASSSSRDGNVPSGRTVRGTPDEASGYASAYLDQLRTDTVLAQYFDDFGFSGQGVSRNPQTHRLSLQLFLHFKNAPKGERR